jgi:hypothetical protein
VRISDVSTEIGTEHLPNKSQELDSRASRFGGFNDAVYKALLHFLNFCAVTCKYTDVSKRNRVRYLLKVKVKKAKPVTEAARSKA